MTINAGGDYVGRLQRIAQSAAESEETYRTVIDELPDPNRQRNGSIAIVLRYLVPTFFMSPMLAAAPELFIARRGGATVLAATNSGDKRIQIIDLRLMVAKGRSLMVGKGLAGYVLGDPRALDASEQSGRGERRRGRGGERSWPDQRSCLALTVRPACCSSPPGSARYQRTRRRNWRRSPCSPRSFRSRAPCVSKC